MGSFSFAATSWWRGRRGDEWGGANSVSVPPVNLAFDDQFAKRGLSGGTQSVVVSTGGQFAHVDAQAVATALQAKAPLQHVAAKRVEEQQLRLRGNLQGRSEARRSR